MAPEGYDQALLERVAQSRPFESDVHAQAAEEAKFDNLALPGVDAGQRLHHLVQRQQIDPWLFRG
jgi:hypothetical protein